MFLNTHTVELHLSGLNGTPNHPDMQKIRIVGLFINTLHWLGCYYLQYVAVSKLLVGRPEGKRPLGRPRRRWEDNIKMDLQQVGCGGMDWTDLIKIGTGGRGGCCEYGNEPSGSIKCGEFLVWPRTG